MTTAEQIAAIRALLPTTLGSAELREQIASDIRVRSVFVSRASNAVFLSNLKGLVEKLAAGDMDHASARLALRQILSELGYTPEGGFPEVEAGAVPPAEPGSLQDLTSTRRLDLILETQVDLVRGRGMQIRGMEPTVLRMWPAWELVRAIQTAVPRDWQSRWVVAGGTLVDGGRMIALKADPIWGELGSSGNFEDALDVDFPPFAFNSGMRWTPITRSEVSRLGITGPDGQSVEEWQAEDRNILTGTQSGLPAPQVSVKKVDPDLRRELEKQGVSIVDDTATTPGNEENLRKQLEERAAAREARAAERMRKSIEERQEEYERRHPS
jgi:hypothetical protein